MTAGNTPIETPTNVACRHDATGLRQGRDQTSKSKLRLSLTRVIMPPQGHSNSTAPHSLRLFRHRNAITARQQPCQLKQNPFRIFADSGLLEQRI